MLPADANNDGVIDKPSYKDFLFLNWMHFCYYFLFFLVDIIPPHGEAFAEAFLHDLGLLH